MAAPKSRARHPLSSPVSAAWAGIAPRASASDLDQRVLTPREGSPSAPARCLPPVPLQNACAREGSEWVNVRRHRPSARCLFDPVRENALASRSLPRARLTILCDVHRIELVNRSTPNWFLRPGKLKIGRAHV